MAKTKAKVKEIVPLDADIEEEKIALAVLDAKEGLSPDKLPHALKKEMYEQWLSVPAMLRLLPEAELKKMGYDTENPIFMRLVSIGSQRQFARVFGIDRNTPTHWEQKDPEMRQRAMAVAREQHALKYAKDVDFSFTQKVLKFGDANRVKLWYQIMTGWSEKFEHRNINTNIDVVGLVQQIEKRNAEIRATEED